jgi:hypothetical protein
MKLIELEKTVQNNSGEFLCERIHSKDITKVVSFKHIYDQPFSLEEIAVFGQLREFYETFGNLLLYFDEKSGDAALYIARPDQWDSLNSQSLKIIHPIEI